MKWWESIVHIIGITICHYVFIKNYSLIFKNKIFNINMKNVLLLLVVTIITYYNTFYNNGFSKIIIGFLELFLMFKSIYKENIKETFIKTLILYLINCVVEILIGGLVFYMLFENLETYNESIVIKLLFSNLISLSMLLIGYIKFTQRIFYKLYQLMKRLINVTLVILMLIIALVLIAYYLIVSTNMFTYISLIIVTSILFVLIAITLYEIIQTKRANDKQEILLNFMKEYEMIIDKERIDRHEMDNNLLVLKSIKDKNTKQYDKILDDTLLTYQSNKTSKGLYELPSGLKGLFYYKIYDMKNRDIEVFINISNKIFKDLDRIDSKNLTKICKILGILLDNAKEAASESKEKLVVIDLYKEENNIIIYIENTINENNSIDINKMKVKGFSTKGKNRGYGLYIVNTLLGETNEILLDQKIKENKFISIVTIKK